jgi:hypothetical protein
MTMNRKSKARYRFALVSYSRSCSEGLEWIHDANGHRIAHRIYRPFYPSNSFQAFSLLASYRAALARPIADLTERYLRVMAMREMRSLHEVQQRMAKAV